MNPRFSVATANKEVNKTARWYFGGKSNQQIKLLITSFFLSSFGNCFKPMIARTYWNTFLSGISCSFAACCTHPLDMMKVLNDIICFSTHISTVIYTAPWRNACVHICTVGTLANPYFGTETLHISFATIRGQKEGNFFIIQWTKRICNS